MQVYKTAVTFEDDGDLYHADTIEHDGQMWLVPEWIDGPSAGWRMPKRIICLNTMPHERADGKSGDAFVVRWPIPKCVFDGRVPTGAKTKYVVVERPEIRVPAIG